MSVIGLVPMKGHSERVPGKNLRPIAGRPLFHWIVEALLDAEGVDEVMVDTDSDDIEAAVKGSFPEVLVHRRPEHLHGDMVPMHDIVTDVANSISHDVLLQTHSTNPLLSPGTIDEAVDAFDGSIGEDSLMSVTARRTRFFYADGRPVNHDPTKLDRTQDLTPLLEENSNIYIAPSELIRSTRLRVGPNPLLFEVDPSEAMDIDDEFDFQVAECLLEKRLG